MFKKLTVFISAIALIVAASAAASYFLAPVLREEFLHAARNALGSEIELSGFRVGILRGVIYLKGLKAEDIRPLQYRNSVTADEIILDIDLAAVILRRKAIFQKLTLKNLVLRLDNRKRDVAPPARPPVGEGAASPKGANLSQFVSDEFYFREIAIVDSRFVFEDYHVTPAPNTIKLDNINGRFSRLRLSLRKEPSVNGDLSIESSLGTNDKSRMELDGSFYKGSEGVDFDLKLSFDRLDLTDFSPYYSQTSFTILRKAALDLESSAVCRKNRLKAVQNARIYDIELEDIALREGDRLFGLPAKTVIEFFKDSKFDVSFSFNLVGELNDLKFDPDPLIKKILSRALADKIMSQIQEWPRDVVKMGEKAIKKGLIDGGEDIEDIERELDKVKEKFNKLFN